MPSSSDRHEIQRVDLRHYLKVVWRRKWSIAAVVAVTVTSAVIFTSMQIPSFEASATILIDPEPPRITNVQDPVPMIGGAADDYYATQYKLLRSRPLIENVMRRTRAKERFPWLAQVADPYLMFVPGLVVTPVKNTRLALVTFYSPDPVWAAEVANAVAHEYVRYNLELKHKIAQEALTWLSEQLGVLRTQTQQSSKALQAHQAQADLLGLQEQRQIAQTKILDVNRMYLEAQNQRLMIEAKLRELSRAVQDPKTAETIFTVADDPMIRKLRTEASDLQMERTKLAQLYKEKHPDLQIIDAQIKQVNLRLQAEMQKLLRAVETELKVARSREETLMANVTELRKDARRLNEKETQALGLYRDKDSNEDLYAVVLKRSKDIGMSTGLEMNNVRIVELALPPRFPSSPRKNLIWTLSVVAGLALGVGMALVAESVDNKVRSAEDIERIVGLPILGVVPVFDTRRKA